MSVEIRVPTLGESVTEATIGQWYKKVGDTVAADEPVVELETDKVTVEVPAPSAGTLEAISVEQGETVEVGALIGAIAEGAGGGKSEKADKAEEPAPKAEEAKAEAPKQTTKEASEGDTPPSPAAQKLLKEHELDPAKIEGSGKGGQILKEDVLAAAEKPATKSAAPASAPSPAPAAPRAPSNADDASREERVKMTRLRKTIATRLKDAQNTAAMLTTFNEVDMKPVMDLRKSYKDLFEKKHGVKLGFMGFFAKAVCHALKEIPAVNAEIDGDDLIYKNYAHIGVAVGTDKGLVVPVVRDADQMTIAEIEKEILSNKDHTETDIQFHNIIAKSSQNPIINRILPIINEGISEGYRETKDISESGDTVLYHHKKILEAIKKGDSELARKCMTDHLIYGMEQIINK